jgi:hypothetical protein|tara:strand:+ start:1007 stop:1228 length:222 start_codon:yes stop_codon:yes gene_type:complete
MSIKLIERELRRHFHFVISAKEILYSNPKHIRGIWSYKDKKKLYDLEQKIQKKRITLSHREFQFLESIVEKYG